MLVLTRKSGEAIRIGDCIEIRVDRVRGKTVKLYVTAPREIPITRSELIEFSDEKKSLPENKAPVPVEVMQC